MKKKIVLSVALIALMAVVLTGCSTADVFGPMLDENYGVVPVEPIPEPEPEAEEEIPECAIRVMSYNIRYYNLSTDDQDNWMKRRTYVVKRITDNNPDLIGTQEVTNPQKEYFQLKLGKIYEIVGVPRDVNSKGEPTGEGSYIFVKKSKFEILDSGTEWLSETPNEVSRGWDGACNRVVTYVKLRHIAGGQVFVYYNTHLDHKGKLAIENGNNQILEHIKAETVPAIYTGDFNHNEESSNYDRTVAVLKDSRHATDNTMSGYTYTGYNTARINDPAGLPIDHCFVSSSIEVKSYKIDNQLIDGWFASDHFPIVVDMIVK